MHFPYAEYLDSEDSILFFQNQENELIIDHGPFTAHAEPTTDLPCFYLNDFRLRSSTPWLTSSRTSSLNELNLPNPQALYLALTAPSSTAFGEVFEHISKNILAGKIQKSVPVACESATITADQKKQLFSNALHHQLKRQTSHDQTLYGFYHPECAFIGHSPEHLFTVKKNQLSTMALAGTARADEIEVFQIDDKEIREHEFVVNYIMSKLFDFGEVIRHPRAIKTLGKIAHLHSSIEVELNKQHDHDLNKIIKLLHPTPALGPLPKMSSSLNDLMTWRQKLHCPDTFGAPFGYYDGEKFSSIVSIRNIHWQGSQLTIPAGCGIIEASRLTNEWRELRLKREAIKDAFIIQS